MSHGRFILCRQAWPRSGLAGLEYAGHADCESDFLPGHCGAGGRLSLSTCTAERGSLRPGVAASVDIHLVGRIAAGHDAMAIGTAYKSNLARISGPNSSTGAVFKPFSPEKPHQCWSFMSWIAALTAFIWLTSASEKIDADLPPALCSDLRDASYLPGGDISAAQKRWMMRRC